MMHWGGYKSTSRPSPDLVRLLTYWLLSVMFTASLKTLLKSCVPNMAVINELSASAVTPFQSWNNRCFLFGWNHCLWIRWKNDNNKVLSYCGSRDRIHMCNSDLGRLITAVSSCCCWGGCSFNKPQCTGWEPAGRGDGQQSEKHCVTSRKQLTTGPAFRPAVASNLVFCCWDQRNKDTYVRSLKTLEKKS